MERSKIHSMALFLAAFALPLMAACSRQEESLPEETAEAALYLNIATIGQTRAGAAALPDNERMHSVRVVVLHADGTVEHNRHIQLTEAREKQTVVLKVTPGEKKKVFLFANEESVSEAKGVTAAGEDRTLTTFFDGYTEGTSGFEVAVNDLYFAPDYSGGKAIPMSSVYEIEFPEKGNFDGKFHVVRVATRFTINFKNWRSEKVTVNKFTLANYADRNYLMAHVDESERNRLLFDGKTWIDWLRKVSGASSGDSGQDAKEAAGWLKDYRLPTEADVTKTYTHDKAVTVGVPEDDSKPGTAERVFYLPESKNLKAGAADGEQEYTLTIDVDGRDKPFICPLPNLKALFRNTHVVVDITMYNSMEIKVEVHPWNEVEVPEIIL